MPIERLRIQDLRPGERADLESALNTLDSRSFESRRVNSISLWCIAAWLLLGEMMLMDRVKDSYREGGPLRFFEGFITALPWSLPFLLEADFLLFVASGVLPFVIVGLVVYAWHQDEEVHALTSFGLVRKRRNALRVLRYRDVAETRLGRGWTLSRGEPTDRLDVLARGGGRLIVYGDQESLAEWKSRIDSRRYSGDTDSRQLA